MSLIPLSLPTSPFRFGSRSAANQRDYTTCVVGGGIKMLELRPSCLLSILRRPTGFARGFSVVID